MAGGPGGGPGSPNDPLTSSSGLDVDLTAWTWWWELNREPFLVLPALVDTSRPVTGGGSDLLGLGRDVRGLGGRPEQATLFGKVVPALLRVLDRERSGELVSAAAIALGRIGASRGPDKTGAYAEVLRGALSKGDLEQEQAALLALGLLGDGTSATLLAGVLLESRAARESLAQTRVPEALRVRAAYALGLLGDTANEDVRRYAVHQLVWCLETDRSRSVDLHAACINALGVIPVEDVALGPTARGEVPPPGSSLGAQVDYLLSLLDEGRRDARVRAQVPIALGRLLQRANGERREELRGRVVEGLMDRLAAHRREPREVVQSCVIALGQLGDDDEDQLDRRLRRVLVRVEDLVNDVAARQYALISLGRVCGRRGPSSPDSLKDERNYLLHELGRGGTLSRPWAALAIGVWCRSKPDEPNLRRALRLALDEARTDRDQSAFALAAGLARDSGASDLLVAQLERRKGETTAASTALALGLSGAVQTRSVLLDTLPRARFQPALLHDAGLGLALLGDSAVIGALGQVLESAGSLPSQAAAGQALSRTKDERAVDTLLKLLDDPHGTDLSRAYAASALGNLGDARSLPWQAIYAVDANLHAAPSGLFDPRGGGLLNVR